MATEDSAVTAEAPLRLTAGRKTESTMDSAKFSVAEVTSAAPVAIPVPEQLV
jgi:hypothetical protein